MAEYLVVSNSSLCSAAQCTLKALLSFTLRLQNPTKAVARDVGIAWHAAAQVIFSHGTIDEAMQRFNALHPANNPTYTENMVKIPKRLSLENTSIIFRAWATAHHPSNLPYILIPEMTEGWFHIPLTSYITLRGRTDFGCMLPDINIQIPGDFKTTSKISQWTWRDYRLSSQVSCYLWALRQLYKNPNITQMTINIAELSTLPNPTRKCPTHNVKFSECMHNHAKWETAYCYRTELQLEEWHRTAVYWAKRLEHLRDNYNSIDAIPYVRSHGTFTGACKLCDFEDFCLSDRSKQWLQSNLIPYTDPELKPID